MGKRGVFGIWWRTIEEINRGRVSLNRTIYPEKEDTLPFVCGGVT